MAIWWNHTQQTLRFNFRDELYEVPPGAEVTIPDVFDWLPGSRGLPLTKGPSPLDRAPRVVPGAVPVPPKPVLPEGVTTGAAAMFGGPDGDDTDDEGLDDPPGPSTTVAKTLEKLHKQGVKVPGKR